MIADPYGVVDFQRGKSKIGRDRGRWNVFVLIGLSLVSVVMGRTLLQFHTNKRASILRSTAQREG